VAGGSSGVCGDGHQGHVHLHHRPGGGQQRPGEGRGGG